jgi:hypothetical protein
MKKYLFRIFVFVTVGALIGELTVRLFDLGVDFPESYQDESQLIRYLPNQTGKSVQRFQWFINEYGNYGPAPRSLDSLITVIGNSYIVNTMNPPECHQAYCLARENQDFNFFPISRDGSSFLEFMEMVKSVESLNALKHMLYVHDEDFLYSVVEIKDQPLTVQYSLEKKEIRHALFATSKLKDLLYKSEFAYFIYRNYFVLADLNLFHKEEEVVEEEKSYDYESLELLFDLVKGHYRIDNVLLVFFPGSDERLMAMAEQTGFETMELETDDYNSWLTSIGGHWSCYGHEEVARQVAQYLRQTMY